jgi:hypothetical protein
MNQKNCSALCERSFEMKKTMVLSCSLLLLLAIPAIAEFQAGKQTKTVPRYVCGAMNGAFSFEYFGAGEWDFYSLGEAPGILRHLGQSTLITQHTPTQSGDLLDGKFKIVAANGDEIQGTYKGSAEYISDKAPQIFGEAVLEIAGGTGRFAHATGTLNATFLETMDMTTWIFPVTWTLSGTVNY